MQLEKQLPTKDGFSLDTHIPLVLPPCPSNPVTELSHLVCDLMVLPSGVSVPEILG